MKFRTLAKQIFKIVIQCSLVFMVTLFLFEVAFRLYLIDFYKSSFEYLNSEFADRNTDKTLMIIGDSFSSFKGGYPNVLHDSLTEFMVRNISVLAPRYANNIFLENTTSRKRILIYSFISFMLATISLVGTII